MQNSSPHAVHPFEIAAIIAAALLQVAATALWFKDLA